jgi:hypothetical protein
VATRERSAATDIISPRMCPQLTGWRQQSEKRQKLPLAPPAELRGASPRAAAPHTIDPLPPPTTGDKTGSTRASTPCTRFRGAQTCAHDRSGARNGTEPNPQGVLEFGNQQQPNRTKPRREQEKE